MNIPITKEEAAIIRKVFFPANPNKMRNADPRVVELAKKMIAILESASK